MLVVAVGVPLIHYVPIDALRVVVGALLLVLGLSWLRKAILRASGHKDLHDEDKIYAETVAELSSEPTATARRSPDKGRDGVGFAVAFKGVFLEGMEVVLIVISLGAAQNRLGLAALAAGAAVVLVGIVGLLVARQLSEVPENTIKTAGRRHADQLRRVLGRRGRRGQLARQRPGHPGAGRLLRRASTSR